MSPRLRSPLGTPTRSSITRRRWILSVHHPDGLARNELWSLCGRLGSPPNGRESGTGSAIPSWKSKGHTSFQIFMSTSESSFRVSGACFAGNRGLTPSVAALSACLQDPERPGSPCRPSSKPCAMTDSLEASFGSQTATSCASRPWKPGDKCGQVRVRKRRGFVSPECGADWRGHSRRANFTSSSRPSRRSMRDFQTNRTSTSSSPLLGWSFSMRHIDRSLRPSRRSCRTSD